MYIGIDIGGTKTLIASLTNEGTISESTKFPTPKDYKDFIGILTQNIDNLATKSFKACGVAIPGKVDRTTGNGIVFGNLPWKNVPIRRDLEKLLDCPVVVENDANLAGLSESMLLRQHSKVLHITVSTGIGTGFIVDRQIDPGFSRFGGWVYDA